MIEDDTHDKLTKAYLEYYKANEKFEAANSLRTHKTVSRRWLREIRTLAKIRMDEIHEHHNTTRQTKKRPGTIIGNGIYVPLDLSRQTSRYYS